MCEPGWSQLAKNALRIVDPPSSARNAYPISTFVLNAAETAVKRFGGK